MQKPELARADLSIACTSVDAQVEARESFTNFDVIGERRLKVPIAQLREVHYPFSV
jgi:hypothetical protein